MAEKREPFDWRKLKPRYPNRPDIPKDRRAAMRIPDAHKIVDEALERNPRRLLDQWPDIVGFGIGVRERGGKIVPNDLVLTCFVQRKRSLSQLKPARRIDKSVKIAGITLGTDVIAIPGMGLARTAATVSPQTLAQNNPPFSVVPLVGGMEFGRLNASKHGTLTAIFRDWAGHGRIWATNTHVVDAGSGPMIEPAVPPNLPHNECGTPDWAIPYVVPNLFGLLTGIPINHLDAARGSLSLSVFPPGHHTAPQAPRDELLDAGEISGWVDAYPAQPVRKSGSFSSVTRGYTIVGSAAFGLGFLSSFLPVPIPLLGAGSVIGGLTVHRLWSHGGDSGSAIVDDSDNFTALLWGCTDVDNGSDITFGDIASNVLLWLAIKP